MSKEVFDKIAEGLKEVLEVVMTDLPRPNVKVTPATNIDPSAPTGSVDVVITKEGFSTIKTYRTVGGSASDVVKDAIEKVLNDPRTAEDVYEEKLK